MFHFSLSFLTLMWHSQLIRFFWTAHAWVGVAAERCSITAAPAVNPPRYNIRKQSEGKQELNDVLVKQNTTGFTEAWF